MIVFPPPHWLHPPSFLRPEAHIQSSGNPSENNNSHCSLHSFISLHAEKIYLNLDDCPCLLEFLRAGTGREQWLGWLGLTYELEPELQLLKMFLPLEHRTAAGPVEEREAGRKAGSGWEENAQGGEETSPACNTPAAAGGVQASKEIGDLRINDTRFVAHHPTINHNLTSPFQDSEEVEL